MRGVARLVVALRARGAGLRFGRARLVGDEPLEMAHKPSENVPRAAEIEALRVAGRDVDHAVLHRDAKLRLQQLGIDSELQQVLALGFARKLRVFRLEDGRLRLAAAYQEVGVAKPRILGQRALVDQFRTAIHGLAGQAGAVGEAAVCRNALGGTESMRGWQLLRSRPPSAPAIPRGAACIIPTVGPNTLQKPIALS